LTKSPPRPPARSAGAGVTLRIGSVGPDFATYVPGDCWARSTETGACLNA